MSVRAGRVLGRVAGVRLPNWTMLTQRSPPAICPRKVEVRSGWVLPPVDPSHPAAYFKLGYRADGRARLLPSRNHE
jgi:hypothetical protein